MMSKWGTLEMDPGVDKPGDPLAAGGSASCARLLLALPGRWKIVTRLKFCAKRSSLESSPTLQLQSTPAQFTETRLHRIKTRGPDVEGQCDSVRAVECVSKPAMLRESPSSRNTMATMQLSDNRTRTGT